MFSVNQKVRGTRSAYVGNVRLTGELWKRPYLPLLSPSTALNLPAWPKPPAGRSRGGGGAHWRSLALPCYSWSFCHELFNLFHVFVLCRNLCQHFIMFSDGGSLGRWELPPTTTPPHPRSFLPHLLSHLIFFNVSNCCVL